MYNRIPRVLVATSSFAVIDFKPLELLQKHGYEVILNNEGRKLTKEKIVDISSECKGLIAGTESYSKEVLDQLPELKVISRLGVGLDNIDMNTAKNNNIQVFKTQTTPAPAVAELTLGLMLDVSRKISEHNEGIKSGIWQKEMGNLLQGKTLGIIGLGTIGKTLVQLIKGFNLEILAFDMYPDARFAMENEVTYCELKDLLTRSNLVSIHLNLSNETKGLIDEEKLNHMKPESILINTSRGEIIDEGALYKALKDKEILGAGLDVFNEEPYIGPFIELRNVILTPHIGSYAQEIRIKMEIESVKNLIKGLNNVK